jgi:hypothetical protein
VPSLVFSEHTGASERRYIAQMRFYAVPCEVIAERLCSCVITMLALLQFESHTAIHAIPCTVLVRVYYSNGNMAFQSYTKDFASGDGNSSIKHQHTGTASMQSCARTRCSTAAGLLQQHALMRGSILWRSPVYTIVHLEHAHYCSCSSTQHTTLCAQAVTTD